MKFKAQNALLACTTALCTFSPWVAHALPQDGVVVAGSASIVTSAQAVDITQSSQKAIIDWRGFDIAPNEAARFHQPSANAITLNRVNSTNATQIDGMLSANGNILIVNPNGVIFGKNSRVDVGGLVASSSDVDNHAFMTSANPVFNKPGSADAKISNAGVITAREAGLVGLIAPQVENSGVITAQLGKVTLASGDTFTLDFAGDGITQIAVTGDIEKQVVKNSGTIEANGGSILLTAAAARDSIDSLIENTGVLRATSVGEREGSVVLYAEGSNAVINNDASQKGIVSGRSTVINSGTIDVSGKNAGEKGGKVQLLADQVAVVTGAVIDASGYAGGGEVEIGGAKLGEGATPASLVTIMQEGSLIDVSSLMSGDAGSVVLWSDDRTEFGGEIKANAYGEAGDGGFVETSGKAILNAYGTVSATSRRGRKGEWFLDPANIEIISGSNDKVSSSGTNPITWVSDGTGTSKVSVTTILNSINAGTNVIIQTGGNGVAEAGNITVSAAIVSTAGTLTGGATQSGSLTLSAYHSIYVNAAIDLYGGSVTLRANNAGAADGSSGSGVVEVAANITTHGGGVTIGGGSGASITAGSGYAVGDSTHAVGVIISGDIDAGGGAIIVNGMGSKTATSNNNNGVAISGGGSLKSTGGIINVHGIGGGSSSGSILNVGVVVIDAGSAIIADGGAQVTITGAGGSGVSDGGYNYGLWIYSGGQVSATGTGTVLSVNATGGAGSQGFNRAIMVGNGTAMSSGSIAVSGSAQATIVGQGNTTSTGEHNHGLYVSASSTVSVDGASSGLSFTLTGGGTGALSGYNYGLLVLGQVIGTNGASLDIRAYGGGGNYWGNHGIFAGSTDGIRTTGGGSITIRVTKGIYGFGVYAPVASAISTSGSGNVTIYTDTLALDVANAFNVSGKLTVASYTDITLGVGATGGYGFNLDDTLIGQMTAGSYQFGTLTTATGAARTQDVSLRTGVDFGTKDVTVVSGHDLTVDAAFSRAAGNTGKLTLEAVRNITVNSAITQRGDMLLRSNSLGAADGSSGTGAIAINAALVSNGANITLGGGTGTITAGSGYAVGNSARAIGVDIGASITVGSGTLIINGIGNKTSTSNENFGVRIQAATISSNGGVIRITGGGGGTGSSASNSGVFLGYSPGYITATGGANVLIRGTGGQSVTGDNNSGVVTAGTSKITADGTGTVLVIEGTGGGSGGSSNNYGILIGYSDTEIAATAGAQIRLTGTGGNSAGTGSTNSGTEILSGSKVTASGAGTVLIIEGIASTASGGWDSNGVKVTGTNSAITAAAGANVTITGQGSGNTGRGVSVENAGKITASGATTILTIQGTGGGSGSMGDNHGVFVTGAGSTISAVDANIEVRGFGGNLLGTGGTNHGIYVNVANGIQTTGSGSITLKGVKGGQSSSYGVYVDVANGVITSGANGTRAITVYADTISLGNANAINAAGLLTVAPYSDITLGVGATSGYGLNLDDTTIGRMTGGSYQFGTLTTATGSSRTQDVSLRTGLDFGTKDVTVVSANNLTVDSVFTRAGGSTGKLTLEAVRNITVNSAITQRGDLLLRANSQGAADGSSGTGAIAINAALASNGAAITLGGGSGTITAGSGYAVGSSTLANGVDIAANVNAGGGTLIINGIGNKTNTADYNHGVNIRNGAKVSSVGGIIRIYGTGGGTGISASNYGIRVGGSGSAIQAGAGTNLIIMGNGGNLSGTGNFNYGVALESAGKITADGTGALLNITGIGGGASSNNHGVYITDTGSAIEATNNANVTIIGTGGSVGTNNQGVRASNAGKITADGVGTVLAVTGTGGGSGSGQYNYGVFVSGTNSAISSTDADISITGFGGNLSGSGGTNHGIYSNVANGIQTTGVGSITLKGVKGGQSSSYGIYVDTANGVITNGASGMRGITLYTDTISLVASAISAAGKLTFATYSDISLGVGATTGYTLNLDDTTISRMVGGSYQFGTVLTATGGTRAQDVSLRTNVTNAGLTGKNVTVVSGRDLTVDAVFTRGVGDTGTLTLEAVRNITVSSAITQRGATLLRSNSQGAANGSSGTGAILITAALSSNGASITLGGGSGTITAGSGYAVGTSAQVVGVDIAANINAGGGTIIINGMGNKVATTSTNHGVQIRNAAGVSSTGGVIRINGTGGGAGVSAGNRGVFLTGGGSVTGTAGTQIYITGYGGNLTGTGASNVGVVIEGTSKVTVDGTGSTLSLQGTGGGAGSGVTNNGITIYGANTFIAATNGATASVKGYGGVASSGDGQRGVYLDAGGQITADGTGSTMTVEGTGGGTGAGIYNHGVMVYASGSAIVATNGGYITITGYGGNLTGTGDTNRGISVESAGKITADGSGSFLQFNGTGGGAGASVSNNGITVHGTNSAIAFTNGADGALVGLGGNSANANRGVTVEGAGKITVDGTGSVVTIQGTANGTGSGANNHGVHVTGTNSTIAATAGADLTITGYGSTAATGNGNTGIKVDSGTKITADGAGTILRVNGTGGGSGASTGNHGIAIYDLNSAIAATAGASVTIKGYGGNLTGGGGSNRGVELGTSGQITASGATTVLVVEGTGGGTGAGSFNYGVSIVGTGTSISSTNSDISVTGIGGNTGGTGGNNHGVYVNIANGIQTTTGGSITIKGVKGGQSTSSGVYADVTGAIITSGASGTRAITVYTDTINLTTTNVINAAGNLTFATYSDISLGVGATTGYTLNLTDTMIGRMVGASYQFGTVLTATNGSRVQSISLQTAIDFGTKDVTVVSGRDLTVDANFTRAAGSTGKLTLQAARNIVVSTGFTITQRGDTLIQSNLLDTGGYVKINGSVLGNGSNITIGGGSGTVTAGSGYALGFGADPAGVLIVGQVNAGGGHIVINGRGSASTSDYNFGINVQGGSVETSGTGTITLNGIGGGSGASKGNIGVLVKSSGYVQTQNGALTIYGQGGAGSNGGHNGVGIESSGQVRTSGSGSITLYAQKGAGSSSGVAFFDATNGIITNGASGARNLTIYADGEVSGSSTTGAFMDIDGTITLATYSDGSLGIGTTSGYTTYISDAVLGKTVAGAYVFGSLLTATGGTRTQDVSLRTGNDFGTKDVTVISGRDLLVDTVFTRAVGSTGKLTLEAVRHITVSAAITQRGNLLLRANSQGAADGSTGTGAILLNAALASNGGSITLGGGLGTITAGSGYAVGSAAAGIEISSNVTTGGGALIINGMGNRTRTADSNHGVYIKNGAAVSSAGGQIDISGIGGGAGISAENWGFALGGTLTASNGAQVNISGQGGNLSGTGGNNHGIFIFATTGNINTSGGSSVVLKGIRGGTGGSDLNLKAGTITGSGTNDSVTLYADRYTGLVSGSVNIAGKLTVTTYNDLSLGVGAASGYDLNLTDTIIGYVTAGSYQFGNLTTAAGATRTKDVSLRTGVDFGTKDVTVVSANDLTVDASFNRAAGSTGKLTLEAVRNIIVNNAITQRGDLLLRSNSQGAANGSSGTGAIQINAALASNGANITLGGGTGSITAGSGYAVGNSTLADGVDIAANVNAGGGTLIINGMGNRTGTTGNSGVYIRNAAVVSSAGGTIRIYGTGGGTSSSTNHGVRVSGTNSEIRATAGTNLQIVGQGGNQSSAGNFNYGVYIDNAGKITADGSATVLNIGATAGGASTGASNRGLVIANTDSAIALTNGAHGTITAQGAASTGDNNYGILISLAGKITADGTGTVLEVNGTGGGAGASVVNYGIQVLGAGSVIAATNSANVTVIGKGGNSTGTGNYNAGVVLENAGKITADAAATVLKVEGEGGGAGAGSSNHGVDIRDTNSAIYASNGANIEVVGKGGNLSGTGGTNRGIYVTAANGIQTTGSGSITLKGVKGGQSNSTGVYIDTANGVVTSGASGTRAITVLTDTITLTTANAINAAGLLTVAPYSDATLGVGATSGYGLNLDGTTISRMTGGSYQFGTLQTAAGVTRTQDVSLQTGIDFGTKDVTVVSANGLTVDAAFNRAAGSTGKLTLEAVRNIIVNYTITQRGDLLLRSNSLGAADGSSGTGAIQVNAALASNGANITLGGGTGTITAGSGYAVGSSTLVVGVDIAANVNTGGGALVINGIGNKTVTTGNNYGVQVRNAAIVSSAGGTIRISGNGGGSGSSTDNYGVYITNAGSTISATNGDVAVTGFGGNLSGSGGVNHGIYVNAANGIQTTGSGSITLRGLKGGQSNSYGIYGNATNGIITSGASGTRGITVYADTIVLSASNAINAAGLLTVAPYNNVTFGVGATSGYGLSLSDATIGQMTAGSYQFGTANTASGVARTVGLSILTGVNFGDKDVSFISNTDIALVSGLTKSTGAGTANYLLRANSGISNSAGAGITASTGGINLTMYGDSDNNGSGTITLNGATTINTGTGSITANGPMLLNGDTVLKGVGVTLNGNVTVDTHGTRSFTVDAGTGIATLAQMGTTNVRLKDLTVTADQMVLNGDLYGTGTVWLQPTTVSRIMSVSGRDYEDTTSNLYLTRTEVGHLVNGWNEIQLGRLNGTGHQVHLGGSGGLLTTFYDNVVVNSAVGGSYMTGNISMQDGASFRTTGSMDIVLSSTLTTDGGSATITGNLFGDGVVISTNGGAVTIGGLYTWDSAPGGTINTTGGTITITGNSGQGGTPSGTRAWLLNAGSGIINFNGTVNASYSLTATAGTINLTGDWGSSTALSAVSLTATNSISLPSIKAGTILVRTTGTNADITINNGKALTASGSGDAIVLAAKRNFLNNSGSATPLVLTGSGRWLVYSTTLANNTRGGMMPDASYFNINYGDALPGGTSSQNLFLYSATTAPVITYTTNNGTVTYGNNYTSADLSYSYTSGLLTGDTLATIGLTGTASLSTTYVAGTTNASDTAYAGMINGATGTLSSKLGYTFNFVAGSLKVDRRVVTISGIGVANKVYDGTTAATITGTGSLNNTVSGDSVSIVSTAATATFADANVDVNKAVTVGGYTLGGTAASNYTLTQPSGFTATITKKDLTVTADSKVVTYGTAVPTGTISYDGFVLSEGTSVLDSTPVVTSANSGVLNAGTYTGNYTLSGGTDNNYNYVFVAGTLTVSKKDLTVTADSKVVTYGTAVPTGTISYDGFISGEGTSVLDSAPIVTSARSGTVNVGTYAGNYTLSGGTDNNYNYVFVAGTLTVNKKDLTVTADTQAVTYGTAVPTGTISYDGFISGEGVSVLDSAPVVTSANSGVLNAGTYTGNYTVSGGTDNNYNYVYVAGALIVGKKDLNVTADTKAVTYGTAVPTGTISYNGFISGEGTSVLDSAPTVASANSGILNAGTYAGNYTVSGGTDNNYNYVYTAGNLVILKKDLNVTADTKAVTYGMAVPTGTISYNGFISGEGTSVLDSAPIVTSANSGVLNAGTYTGNYTVSGGTDNNYNYIYTAGNLVVSKKGLNVVAQGQSVTYGDAVPGTTTLAYSGFVNGDDEGDIDTLATYTVNQSGVLNAGSYANTYVAGGASDGNYSFNYINGTLTVNKKNLAVVANGQTINYGDAVPGTTTVSYTGFVNGDDEGDIDTLAAITVNQSGVLNVGSYANTYVAGGASDGNYSFSYVNGTLTVTKRSINVVAQGQSVTYGTSAPGTTTITYVGFVNGDDESDLDTLATYTVNQSGVLNAGSYANAYVAGGAADSNYSFNYVNGTLTVTKKSLSVVANDRTMDYGDPVPGSTTVSYYGFVNGDDENDLDSLASGVLVLGTSNPYIGTYNNAYMSQGGSDNNYSYQYVGGRLTVEWNNPEPPPLPPVTGPSQSLPPILDMNRRLKELEKELAGDVPVLPLGAALSISGNRTDILYVENLYIPDFETFSLEDCIECKRL